MRYFQSRASNLCGVACLALSFGITYLLFPQEEWIQVISNKTNFLDPVHWIALGIVMAAVSLLWYWLEKRHRENQSVNFVRVREEQIFFKKIFSLSFWAALTAVLFVSFLLGSKELAAGDIGPASLFVYSGPIAVMCFFYLLAELLRWWRTTRLTRKVMKWGAVLFYRPIAERIFPFPARIFNLGVNGAADFVLEKDKAGMTVRFFQYSHTQRNNTHDGIAYYSVVSIVTKDELPSFNLGHLPRAGESIFSASESVLDKKLNEEVSVSSSIPFFLPNGDVFNLSVAKKFEMEALQVFSKELVEDFGTHWQDFFLIGSGKHLIAISEERVKSEENLKKCDDLADFLVDRIALRIERIGKSVEAMKEVMGIRDSSQQ